MAAFSFLSLGVGNSANMIQMTYIFKNFHCVMTHRCLQKTLQFGSKGANGGTVEFTSCTDLRKNVSKCVRVGSRSKPSDKAKDTDPKEIDAKAARRCST